MDIGDPLVSGNVSKKTAAKQELLFLLPNINNVFESEPAVLQINAEQIMVIGDIHEPKKCRGNRRC